MSQYIRRLTAPILMGLALAACGGDDTTDNLAQDTSLSRDLQLAGADTFAQPELTDTFPAAPSERPRVDPAPTPPPPRATTPARTPTRPAPAPKTSTRPADAPRTTESGNTVRQGSGAAERSVGTIAAGTQLTLTSNQRVCTNTHKAGDRFTATVAQTVTGSNGATIPAGATAVVQVVSSKRSENANDPINLVVDVVSISVNGRSYAVESRTTDAAVTKVRASTTQDDAKKVIGGAVIGAIAGQVLGKDTKGTVIGAATGAAAGTAAAAATANFDGCVNDGGRILIVLDESVSVVAAG